MIKKLPKAFVTQENAIEKLMLICDDTIQDPTISPVLTHDQYNRLGIASIVRGTSYNRIISEALEYYELNGGYEKKLISSKGDK